MRKLCILYAADNNYAPFMGVSMYSLFKNNIDIEEISVYAVLDNVCDDYKKKLAAIAAQFNRELYIIDSDDFNKKLEALNIPKFRGNYTTNYRLFFNTIIPDSCERLFYLDADTIVCGSLKNILEADFEDYAAGVVYDSLGVYYKPILGFSADIPYFNAGVLIIDVKNWKKHNVTEHIMNHIMTVRSGYCNPDQDLLNINLVNTVKILGPEYNFQPFHRAYTDDMYRKVYGFDNYYTEEQIENARKNPIIMHTYRFLGEFPWHKNNLHPDTKLFDEYLKETPWADYEKRKTKNNSFVFKIERCLYRLLPKLVFLHLFAVMQKYDYEMQERKLCKKSR